MKQICALLLLAQLGLYAKVSGQRSGTPAQGPVASPQGPVASPQGPGVSFVSSDKALENAFTWAKNMALHYKGKPGDPVGPWYESALPPRDAFCMRDVSHQCIGAEILGLGGENKNMLTRFVDGISASKNWCTYWEMNKWDKPAPEDYRNDREFWYNLDANFDVLFACWRLYSWTGDLSYINAPAFSNFHEKSVREFINEWVLSPDSLLTRPPHPNAPVPFDIKDPFDRCRGLPSYAEGVPNMKMGIDLVAAMYRGMLSYAAILGVRGDRTQAKAYAREAERYRERIESDWWDAGASLYNTYYSNDHQFGKNEGETFLLWFDALKDSSRIRRTIAHITSRDWNMENRSYFPYVLYEQGYWDKAYDYLIRNSDPATQRREYPEVSFGVVEGIVQGLMGVSADAGTRTISSVYRERSGRALATGSSGITATRPFPDTAELKDLPILRTTVDITHLGNRHSLLRNKGALALTWRAMFAGNYSTARVNGRMMNAKKEKDKADNDISYIDIRVDAGRQVDVAVQ